MYFKKGGLSFDEDTVTLSSFSVRPKRSPRGRRMGYVVSMQMTGQLFVDPALTDRGDMQDDLDSKIGIVETSLHNDYESVGFYKDDDSPTLHYIDTDAGNNLTGTLLTYLNWTPGTNEEFYTVRSFNCGFHAEFVDSYSGIFEFKDTITKIGDCGPIYQWRLHPTLGSYVRQLTTSSPQRIVHKGMSIGINGYLDPPNPLFTGVNLMGHMTKHGRLSPSLYGNPGQYALFTTTWEYTYMSATNVDAYPSVG